MLASNKYKGLATFNTLRVQQSLTAGTQLSSITSFQKRDFSKKAPSVSTMLYHQANIINRQLGYLRNKKVSPALKPSDSFVNNF
jgi:hypothetical protein